MPNEPIQKHTGRKIRQLQEQKRQILQLPPAQALERLLSAPEAEALVQSFSEQDFFFLIQNIGIEDALPVLALATEAQWEYVIDIDVWERDRIDPASMSRWLELVYRADSSRCVQWLLTEKLAFLEYFLLNNIDVRIRDHDQDPAELGDDYSSIDNVFYVKIKGLFANQAGELSELEDYQNRRHTDFVHKLLRSLAAVDYTTYLNVLSEAMQVIPSETEEEEFRLRSIRLAEKGLLPFDEAIGIYQPLKTRAPGGRRKASPALTGPQYPLTLVAPGSDFQNALSRIDREDIKLELQSEFAALCNQIIMADHKKVRDATELAKIVRKACGYISIGLQQMVQHASDADADRKPAPAWLLQQHTLIDLFKVGYGQALELKWRVEKWLQDCWFARNGLPLTFWGEEWLGILGGLLIKRPLLFDNFERGTLYREFETSTDIENATDAANAVMAFDRLFADIQISLERVPDETGLTYKSLLLTLWARHRLGIDEIVEPIPLADFKRCYSALWQAEQKTAKIAEPVKADLIDWLSHRTGSDRIGLSQQYAPILKQLFRELEEEFGDVSAEHLDPRFIRHFLVN